MNRLSRWAVVTTAVFAITSLPAPVSAAEEDPLSDRQWGMEQIGVRKAWAASRGAGIRIGIIDSGIDLTHEDLAGKIAAQTSCVGSGGDAAKCNGSAQDDIGHGTHVAGIAAAHADNGKGVIGVAPHADFVVAKVSEGGSTEGEDAKAGIIWAIDHGARVVNISLAAAVSALRTLARTSGVGSSLEEGVEYAWAHGAVVILPSGNENMARSGVGSLNYGDLPALVVGATTKYDIAACYSSPTGNAKWALLAPGGGARQCGDPLDTTDDVLSTWWENGQENRYAYKPGTSMAAPHVAGGVALLLARGYSIQGAVDRLLDTADAKVSCGPNSTNCRGRLDLTAALAG